jgi:coenzyme F420-0:L-glutamate ligase/coenzyme F420-1:gamma-L-glutamate ligase
VAGELRLIALEGIPEIRPGDDLALHVGDAIERAVGTLEPGDVLVIAHKVVSKAEGRIAEVGESGYPAAVLEEAHRVRRRRDDLVIAETRHGFVCAGAGVDRSNAPGDGWVVLLPLDPDASAEQLRDALASRFGVAPAVIVSDSFGRAWRQGTTDVAIGVAGMIPLLDLRGAPDARGRPLEGTAIAIADELAGAAELVRGKAAQTPVALVRGYTAPAGGGCAHDLLMPRERDLFP